MRRTHTQDTCRTCRTYTHREKIGHNTHLLHSPPHCGDTVMLPHLQVQQVHGVSPGLSIRQVAVLVAAEIAGGAVFCVGNV